MTCARHCAAASRATSRRLACTSANCGLEQPGHLSRMRRDRQQFALFCVPSSAARPAKAFSPSASRITGNEVVSRTARMNCCVSVIGGKPRANRQHRFAVGDLREVLTFQVAHAGCALLGGEQARGHQFGHARGHDRQHIPRRSHGGQARAHAQSGASAQYGGSRFAQRARDNQGVAKGAFVRVGLAHQRKSAKFARFEPMQLQMRDRRPAARAACRSRARSDGPRSRREATAAGQAWAR